jgi:hypothetical protein
MKIPVPETYTIPEDIADGDTFEELTTYRLDGTNLVPVMLAGVELELEDEEGEEEEMEDEEAAAVAADETMSAMGARIMGM